MFLFWFQNRNTSIYADLHGREIVEWGPTTPRAFSKDLNMAPKRKIQNVSMAPCQAD
jgi:hypothetical protein